ncbi:unnamed protein product [Protopolystoma xenopodis]|uniref:Uncharacterized protein n=1 Tax=Protopolystoma xenopodis TaxID=117903 RepID=A0A448X8N0_9PLAT|nr:unnamed protein product [Protopolystoma xenopodis]
MTRKDGIIACLTSTRTGSGAGGRRSEASHLASATVGDSDALGLNGGRRADRMASRQLISQSASRTVSGTGQ